MLATGNFPEDNLLLNTDTVENLTKETVIDGNKYHLSLCEYYTYKVCPGTDVALICFDITQSSTLLRGATVWKQRMRYYLPGVPLILLGLKADAREDTVTSYDTRSGKSIPYVTTFRALPRDAPVPPSLALAMAKKIGALTYIECSSKTQTNLTTNVIAEIVRASNISEWKRTLWTCTDKVKVILGNTSPWVIK